MWLLAKTYTINPKKSIIILLHAFHFTFVLIICYHKHMKTKKKYSEIKKNKKAKDTKKFKEKYFEFYDDIKSHTHDVYDW